MYACCQDAGHVGMCVCYIAPAPNYQECWVLKRWISVHVCYTCTRPAAQPKAQPLRMFDYVEWNQHTCQKRRLQASSYVCNSFTRLSGLLQYHFFKKLCSGTAGMFVTYISVSRASTFVVVELSQQVLSVTLASDPQSCLLWLYLTNGLVSTIAPDHHTCMLQWHLTSSHFFICCILSTCVPLTVSSYQHPWMLYLHLAISHVCNNCIQPFVMYLTVAPNQQSCLLNLHLQLCMSDTFARDQY